jgi:hypothetical protein
LVLSQAAHSFFLQNASAGDRKRNYDAIAALQVRHAFAHLLDDPHELMPHHIAGLHRWDEPVIKMQVRSTDRRPRNLNDRVMRVHQLRISDRQRLYLARSHPANCLHNPSKIPLPRRSSLLSFPKGICFFATSRDWEIEISPRPGPSA